MAAHDLPEFDPAIIERYVENTYRKANAVFIGSVVAGVMMGAAFGATPLTSLGASWPIPRMFGFATMLVGAIVGGVIGYLIGDTRAFLARLQGQTALAQVEAAKDARRALEAVQQIQALATKRAAANAPKPPTEQPQSPVPTLAAPPPLTPALRPPEPEPTPQPAPAPALEAVPAPPASPVEAVPAPPQLAPVESVPPVAAPVEAAPAQGAPVAPVPTVAPVEAVPAPQPLEVVAAPAPPTLVVAGGTAEPAPPLTPPVSS